ncbi:hypothetical protein HYV91_00635 [Candidatus Wolfebacteria bacterium]|nr:hypothetical protein [Candidatus Wolfebacteria bacterium]
MNKEKFGSLRNAVQKTRETVKDNVNWETGNNWGIYESGLNRDERGDSYAELFSSVVPLDAKLTNLKKYIEIKLKSHKGQAVGIEVGGQGSRLFRDFSPGFFEKTLGVVLVDKRDEDQKSADEKMKHSVLVEDAFSSKGYREVKKWLGESKVNLICEKMHGASYDIPSDPDYLWLNLSRWYRLLDNHGIMLIQSPPIKKHDMETLMDWLVLTKHNFQGFLDVDWRSETISPKINRFGRIWLRLEKHDGAPKELPKLERNKIN